MSMSGRPDTAISSLVHQVNGYIRPIDRAAFAAGRCFEPAPLFVVGAPRSGTTLTFQVLAYTLRTAFLPRLLDYSYGLSNLAFRCLHRRLLRPHPVFRSTLGRSPGLLSPGEAYGFWRRWFPADGEGAHFHSQSLGLEAAADLRKAIGEIQGHVGAPMLVKCLYLSFAVTAIAEALPHARFLVVTRNPVDVAASLLRARKNIRAHDWWSVRPPGYSIRCAWPLAEQVVWQVLETRSRCSEQLARLPEGRWRMLSFEELCRDPAAALGGIGDWLEPAGYRRREGDQLPKCFPPPPSPSAAELRELATSADYDRLRGDVP